jgi:hypothetical protein
MSKLTTKELIRKKRKRKRKRKNKKCHASPTTQRKKNN